MGLKLQSLKSEIVYSVKIIMIPFQEFITADVELSVTWFPNVYLYLPHKYYPSNPRDIQHRITSQTQCTYGP
jgi:hypothetical protein